MKPPFLHEDVDFDYLANPPEAEGIVSAKCEECEEPLFEGHQYVALDEDHNIKFCDGSCATSYFRSNMLQKITL